MCTVTKVACELVTATCRLIIFYWCPQGYSLKVGELASSKYVICDYTFYELDQVQIIIIIFRSGSFKVYKLKF